MSVVTPLLGRDQLVAPSKSGHSPSAPKYFEYEWLFTYWIIKLPFFLSRSVYLTPSKGVQYYTLNPPCVQNVPDRVLNRKNGKERASLGAVKDTRFL